jgi:hypothetical protein
MDTSKELYAHLHMPKTAGYTLRYHITKNLPKDEHLLLDYEFLGLDLFDPPLRYEIYLKKAIKLIKSLPKEKRKKIKIIHGHTVPYGLEEVFDKAIKYITFTRNPLDRTISVYNHLSHLNDVEGKGKRMLPYYNKYLLINGKDLGFEKWLTQIFVNDIHFNHFSMSGYLKEFGFLKGEIGESTIKTALNKFYFVGLSENFNSESMYIFNELNMHKFFIDQNISIRKFRGSVSKRLSDDILKRNRFDSFIYMYSKNINQSFKLATPDFNNIVKLKNMEKYLILPFSQTLFAPRQTFLRFYNLIRSRSPLSAEPTYFSRRNN